MKELSKKVYKYLLYVVPLCLFLSYHPVITLGGDATMNFELSVAEIWLVLFDIVGVVTMIVHKKLFKGFGRWWWLWILLPIWVTLSVIWSLNVTRGLLTAGLMWAIVVAGYVMWGLRGLLDDMFRRRWWMWFFGSTLAICVWCVVQCVMDLAGVGQECTLLCDGCTYRMFGFPHPNGFAIEPQFMGNLLLAPIIVSTWLYLNRKQTNKNLEWECSRDSHFHNRSVGARTKFQFRDSLRDCCKNDNGSHSLCSRFLLVCFLIIATTLFLTFSRGAIYAFVVGLLFLSGWVVARDGKARCAVWKRVGLVWGMVVVSFVVALNVQGLMAQLGPTNDTYTTGVAKVLNQLSLGIIDIREPNNSGGEVVEKSVENTEENGVENSSGGDVVVENGEAVFDGYVAESTDTRLRLTGAAMTIWKQDFKTAMVGVGLGGAGQALYNNDLSPAPKEIVQNEYASLLLEVGLIGATLAVLTLVLFIKIVIRSSVAGMVLALTVAYGVSLMFFSGLPNALQIYLMPIVLVVIGSVKTIKR